MAASKFSYMQGYMYYLIPCQALPCVDSPRLRKFARLFSRRVCLSGHRARAMRESFCACHPRAWTSICLVFSLVGLLIGTVGHDLVATLIRSKIRAYAVLSSNESGAFASWLDSRDPSAGKLVCTYYLFNVTNPAEVLRGARPHLREFGPLTYNYVQTKHELRWEAGGSELVYKSYQRQIAADEATREREQVPITSPDLIFLAALHSGLKDLVHRSDFYIAIRRA